MSANYKRVKLDVKPQPGLNLLQRIRIGDKVEAVAKAVGIKPCESCMKRKRFLNGEPVERIAR